MEELELTDPVTTPPQTTASYKVTSLVLEWTRVQAPATSEPGVVSIHLRSNLGEPFAHQYLGQEATDLMKWMNTANFSTSSMHKRILQKLSADGVLPGTVTGAPDP
jgi:hypothetical protein